MKKNKLFKFIFAFIVAISFSFIVNYCYAASAQVDISNKSNNKYTINIKNGKGFVARIEYSVPGTLGTRKSILFALLLYNAKFCANYS